MKTFLKSALVHLRGCYPSRIVLRLDPGAVQQYVVHCEVHPTEPDRPVYYVEGGYHDKLEDAVHEFGDRALRDLRRAIAQQEQDDRLLRDIEEMAS